MELKVSDLNTQEQLDYLIHYRREQVKDKPLKYQKFYLKSKKEKLTILYMCWGVLLSVLILCLILFKNEWIINALIWFVLIVWGFYFAYLFNMFFFKGLYYKLLETLWITYNKQETNNRQSTISRNKQWESEWWDLRSRNETTLTKSEYIKQQKHLNS